VNAEDSVRVGLGFIPVDGKAYFPSAVNIETFKIAIHSPVW